TPQPFGFSYLLLGVSLKIAAVDTPGSADLEQGRCSSGGERRREAAERDCRICHLGLESSSDECGIGIELGCSCKNDLGAAHKHCAEAWFKIRGNKTCEICHSVVSNVIGAHEVEPVEQLSESNNATVSTTTVATSVTGGPNGGRSFWQVHRVLNFLLACMVFAFVISWLFHFNVPS
ncbi:uncharacterized protein LOC111019441, partial [Momordica charantia]|uniref:Uncharacterized protein LOC111019441 n=1 Tax=Momordica charantia TaxID=3673 RepID=A0A6J1DBE4_MOMCH